MGEPSNPNSPPILAVENLRVALRSTGAVLSGPTSFELPRAKTLALVGPSGSGKSLAALAFLGLLPEATFRVAGRIVLDGVDLLAAPEELPKRRGKTIAMVFQEPATALNPSFSIGAQIADAARFAGGRTRALARRRARILLEQVGLRPVDEFAQRYPHELSGGQRQRAVIAMALANDPAVIVADEPVSALDAVIARDILDLLAGAVAERGAALVLVTHDPRTVERYADFVTEFGAERSAGGAA